MLYIDTANIIFNDSITGEHTCKKSDKVWNYILNHTTDVIV